MLELLVVMAIMGILAAIAVPSLTAWTRSSQQAGVSRDLVGQLRQVEQYAVTQNTTFRVTFGATTAAIAKYDTASNAWVSFRSYQSTSSAVTFANANFSSSSGANVCYFTARGTATRGSIQVIRSSSSKTYTISVEGLTARVSYQ
jgi:Tfp pilus assembly protein FimT